MATSEAFSKSSHIICDPPADKIFVNGTFIRVISPMPFTNQIEIVIKSLIDNNSNPDQSINSTYDSNTNSTQNSTSDNSQYGNGSGNSGDSPVP